MTQRTEALETEAGKSLNIKGYDQMSCLQAVYVPAETTSTPSVHLFSAEREAERETFFNRRRY